VPAGFADRAFVAVTRDRRRRRHQAWAGRVSVAATLLVGVVFASTGLRQPAQVEFAEVAPVAPTLVSPLNPLGDARDAVASVTQRASETALAPARNLFAGFTESPEAITPPNELPTVSVAVLDPLTDTTRRAVNFFLKDVRSLAAADPEATR